jgi:hypothetical protein
MQSTARPFGMACVVIAVALVPAYGQLFQDGPKLVGTGAVGTALQGYSVALSADGNTALVAGYYDNTGVGAAWVFTRSSSGWVQQGAKLVPSDAVGAAGFGDSVALSYDGNTALIGGYHDNAHQGAAWVFVRSGSAWSQQGAKLLPSDSSEEPDFGYSVALSADGNTALIGGAGDTSSVGAAWVFTRTVSTWSQQGNKLVGSGSSGNAGQGAAVALSSNADTALIGGPYDNANAGAAWIFTFSGATWTQQGAKLVGTGAVGAAFQGVSAALSGDGATAMLGGNQDNSNVGAVWVFALSGGVWSQQGTKLVGADAVGAAQTGVSTALSTNGNIALFGGSADNSGAGAFWVFTRSGATWTQQGAKLVGGGATGAASQGASVAMSPTANAAYTAISGGYADASYAGAAWIFAVPALTVVAPAGVEAGTAFNVAVNAQDSAGALVTGYSDLLHFTSTDGAATLPADSTLTNGAGLFPVTLVTAGNQTVTATDTVYADITGASAPVNVSVPDDTISGQVTLSATGLSGVTMTLSGSQSGTATTAASGNYGFAEAAGGSYTVTPSLTGYTFSPVSQTFNSLNGNQTANFVASIVVTVYTISGQTLLDGNALNGVTVMLSGSQSGSVITSGTGNYSFSVPPGGNYTVTASGTGTDYYFYPYPASATFSNLSSSQTANFQAAVPGDFNHDGYPDVVWQEPSIGAAQVWYLGGPQGVSITDAADLTQANPWQIVGIADFNGDGNPDVLWQDPVHGAVQVWYLGGLLGNQIIGTADITTSNPWRVVSVADFNGDGHPDLLWQDPVNGFSQIWYLGGSQGITLLGAADLDQTNPWRIVGTGDFNSDGTPDVLWQDPVSGTVQIWYMGGTTPGSQGTQLVSTANLTGAMTTKVVAIADFNLDGHPDVVFQDPATGAATVYYYNGAQGITPNGTAVLSTGNPWYIAGPH